MIRRIVVTLIVVSLGAVACATTSEPSGENATASDADGNRSEASASGSSTSTTTVVSGPTTTFVPALDGPFDLSGGATFAAAAVAGLIIEDAPDLGGLAAYPWPTDWTRRTVVDLSELSPGLGASDPRDGIPPIDTPVFETTALAAQWLGPREPGALVQLNGETRFYPLSILTQHEIVNDVIGDVPVAVTFCPLCNTAIAYDRRVNGEVLRFGVSGLLRNSDLVMWDEGTTSLWQQITGNGIVGEFAGAQLESVPTSIVSFSQFVKSFPDGKSLSGDSARGRGAYGVNPYTGYSSATPFLFSGETDGRLDALSRVVGISEDGAIASYPFERLQAEQVINDDIDGTAVVVFFAGDTADALDDRAIATSAAIGSAVAHSPVLDGQVLTFAATDDDTFIDDQTGSTWSIVGFAIDGPLAGTQLGAIEHRNEFWFAWQAFFGPDSLRP